MVEDISDLYNDYSRSTLNIIINIDKGKSKATNHSDNEDWISRIISDESMIRVEGSEKEKEEEEEEEKDKEQGEEVLNAA
jgi:hypothetical protein